ncbi:cytochrome P450 20A1 [Erpetoichthys calabaricus]|uniref:Cytochrome P450, family 20, subfamily A, polypeptide 1 n=1 Tax=Erpetoichthys calabaricus TaxID=27687 RepID=A0A8C4S2E6_ERPCA|nr:cytochrome P450 20A1 [Erpetoichthys calabaricus]
MLDFVIFAVTFLLLLVGAVLYLYPASRTALGIPGLTPTEEKDGNLPDIVNRGGLHDFLVALHERYGAAASFWFGRRLVVSLGSLELLQQHSNPNRTMDPFETVLKPLLGYHASDGTEGIVRKKMHETAVSKTLQSNFSLLNKLADELVDKWASYPSSQHVPLCQHLLGFAMKAVTQTTMGSRFIEDREVIEFRKNHDTIWSEIGKGFLDGSLEKSSTRKAQYEKAVMYVETVMKDIIKERKGTSSPQHIFMDTLLQANLSERQVLEDSVIFSLVGCIITANLCSWAVYFLSTVEDVQEELHRELEEVLGQGPVTLDKLEQLRLCRRVLHETVRTAKLTPVAARVQELEGRVDQHVIPKETLVIYALGVVLQDAAIWPLPYRFDPHRFDEESARKSLSLLGFSGSQECPELRFAYVVATVLLCSLLNRLKLCKVSSQVVEERCELVSSPKEEAWISVSRRS